MFPVNSFLLEFHAFEYYGIVDFSFNNSFVQYPPVGVQQPYFIAHIQVSQFRISPTNRRHYHHLLHHLQIRGRYNPSPRDLIFYSFYPFYFNLNHISFNSFKF